MFLRRRIINFALLLLLAGCATAPPAAKQPPNLLFIIVDEMRYDLLAAYGNDRIRMPNLDRFAAKSVVFERAYVVQPVCTPSRATLLTGVYPHTHGCVDNNIAIPASLPVVPELLPKNYRTGYMGKWHLGDEVFAQRGFEEWVSIEDYYFKNFSAGRDKETRSSYHHWLIAQGLKPADGKTFSREESTRLPEKFGKPAFLAAEAERFLSQGKDPFALYVSFLEPHMPFFGPRDNEYDPADVLLPPNFDHLLSADQPLKARLYQASLAEVGFDGLPLKTEADWRRMIANYWGLCSLIDTYVGKILDALERNGQAGNTMIVFTTDHGDMMGSHKLLTKGFQFEEAVRVPLILNLPGQTAGVRVKESVSHVDLLPTMLDYLGCPIPTHFQGSTLRPLIEGRGGGRDVIIEWNAGPGSTPAQISKPIFEGKLPPGLQGKVTPEQAKAAFYDPIRTILTPDGWKLSVSLKLGEHALYNLNDDPQERKNLVRDPAHKTRINDLLERLGRRMAETSDSAALPERL